MKNDWIENEDYYFNEQGFIVLTAKYLLNRGYCCGNGCRHCPYEAPSQPLPEGEELNSSKKS